MIEVLILLLKKTTIIANKQKLYQFLIVSKKGADGLPGIGQKGERGDIGQSGLPGLPGLEGLKGKVICNFCCLKFAKLCSIKINHKFINILGDRGDVGLPGEQGVSGLKGDKGFKGNY